MKQFKLNPFVSQSVLCRLLALLFVVASMLPLAALPGKAQVGNLSQTLNEEGNKKAFGEFIRSYLMENPEVIRDAWQEFTRREEEKQRQEAQASISTYAKELFESNNGWVVGNPEGDVTLVEFFDYNCGYCRRAHSDLVTLIQDDPKLKVVLREWPILGPQSVEAHEVAAAVGLIAPELYFDFHEKLLINPEKADKAVALSVAKEVGVDMEALEKQMEDKNTLSPIFQESFLLTGVLGINGTPAYVLKDEIISGAIGAGALKAKIDNVRKCGSTNCS